jgi:diguanylate cyclase
MQGRTSEDVLVASVVAQARERAQASATLRGSLRSWDNLTGAARSPQERRRRELLLLPRLYQALLGADPSATLTLPADPSPLDRLVFASSRLRAGDLPAAAEHLRAAERRLEEAPDDDLRVAVGVTLSQTLGSMGDLATTASVLMETVDRARRTGSRFGEQSALANLGYLYGQQGLSEPYADYTRQALEIARELGEPRLVAHCLNNLAGALTSLGHREEARAIYDECLVITRAIEWPPGEALVLGGLGGLALARGDVDEGLARYAQSAAILAPLGDQYQLARHRFLVGTHLTRLGHHEAAIAELSAAIDAARAHRFHSTLWQALAQRSRSRSALGDAAAALADLEEHVALRAAADEEEIGARVRLARMKLNAQAASKEADRERARAQELQAVNAKLEQALAAQRVLQARVEEAARTDALTGLSNRRHHQETLRAAPADAPIAIVLLDVDHFKRVNDRHGHAIGDAVLVGIAARLRELVRGSDSVARWGGEEFCVTLHGADERVALETGRRIVEGIAARPVMTPAGPVAVTVSVGVAAVRGPSQDQLFLEADRALYHAKRTGRNRVVAASEVVGVTGPA